MTHAQKSAGPLLPCRAGRLTRVQDTVTGPSPSTQTRRYCLDADSNRVAFASDPSVTDLGCPSPQHSYDAADRVTDPGYGYDPLGRTLTVPAADVAGGADLVLGYFDTDLVATQTQGGTVKSFTLDPAGRLGGATDTVNGTTTRSVVNHYADPSDAPAWITTTTGGQSGWTRNVAGLTGDLAATEDNTGAVTLQLANLHGDIVATAADDPAATGTTGYVEATEYGTPRPATTVTPDRYGWLGAKERSSDDLAGLVLMGVRLYNPGTGRFLQVDPVPGANASSYGYPSDPVNNADVDGRGPCGLSAGYPGVYADCLRHREMFVHKNPHMYDSRMGWLGTAGRSIAHGVRWSGRKAWGGVKTVGRCARNPFTCADNIKVAAGPLVFAGAGVVAVWGGAVLCYGTGGLACAVAAPTVAAGIGGLWASYRSAEELWWGPNARRHYHHL